MVSSRFALSFFLIIMPIYVMHGLNDMPLLAQLQGEHNASAFGYSIVSLDFNHDNYDDLIVLSAGYGWVYPYTPSHGKVYVYYGGLGFSSASEPAMTLEGDYPQGMQRMIGSIINPGDINGDGFDDLIIVDRNPDVTGSVRLMFYFGGTCDLTSPDMIEYPLPGESIYNMYELGDVDGDGFGDIGISYQINYYTYFDIMWGGTFTRQNILSLDFASGAPDGSVIGIGDINNDGCHDFSIGYLGEQQGDEQYSTVRVYYGNNSRVFSDYTLMIHTPYSITRTCKPLGDVNNDGFDDFLGYIDNFGMKVWLGTISNLPINPNVTLTPVLFGNTRVGGVKHGDFNGDGFGDVVGASYQARRFAVWLGSSIMNGQSDWQKPHTIENYGYDVAVGDFNGDGYDDIAVSAPFEEGIWPYHDFRGYVFVYAGNPGMVANDDPSAPQLSDRLQMRLSPNPVLTNGEITISISGVYKNRETPLQVEIFNLKGQVMHRIEVNNMLSNELVSTVNISNYSSGMYLCRARIGDQSTIKKFTIIK
ncbi:MAG: FG-GAP repeat protein [Candidatus Syntrophosphaera sp.]|nr:FG-GAP repeat protein [Candidatus Syntrophosphaera sp.]